MNARKAHAFNFEGGEILNKMGAAWFVSYAYHEKKDSTHDAWERVKTFNSRAANYESSRACHRFWLYKILHMSDVSLNKNQIGLPAADVKRMAHELLDVFW